MDRCQPQTSERQAKISVFLKHASGISGEDACSSAADGRETTPASPGQSTLLGSSGVGKAETYKDVNHDKALWWLSSPWKSKLLLGRFAS